MWLPQSHSFHLESEYYDRRMYVRQQNLSPHYGDVMII
jgi:hypothetical protein